MKRCLFPWLVILLAAVSPAAGHDLWVDREAGGYTIRAGHRDGRDHGGAPETRVEPAHVMRASCHGEDGTSRRLDGADAWPLFAEGGCAAFTALLSSGYWTKTASGTKNAPKNEVDDPLKSWLSFESVKRLGRWSDAFAEPLTSDLEVVPLHDPFRVRPGEKLRLRITMDGKPAEGALVLAEGRLRGETDADGRVNVKLRAAGFQSIAASLRGPGDGVRADETVRTATLNFVTGDGE